jgi:general secretion pathway protein G
MNEATPKFRAAVCVEKSREKSHMQATLERLRQRRTQRGEDGGFTLIELLIVIVILGILAGIVVFAVQNLTGSSAKASCGDDLKAVETATEAYKAQLGAYPGLANGWTQGTPPALPAGYPADGGAADGSNNYTTAMKALLSTWTNSGQSVGPWLKDTPLNTGHYAIVVSNDGNGAVQVADSAGNIALTGCAGIS